MSLSSYTKGLQFFLDQELGTIYCMFHIITDNYICKNTTSYIWCTLQNIIFLKNWRWGLTWVRCKVLDSKDPFDLVSWDAPTVDLHWHTCHALIIEFNRLCAETFCCLWVFAFLTEKLCTVSIKISLEFVQLYLPYAVIKIVHHMMLFFKRQT